MISRREVGRTVVAGLALPFVWPNAAAARIEPARSQLRSQSPELLTELGIRSGGPEVVRAEFQRLIDEGQHLGAQLAVYRNGSLAFSMFGGLERAGGKAVEDRTLFQIRSVTKAITVLVMMRLVDQGRIGLDDTVAAYWPEFAQNGKADITIRALLGHRAGIPDWPGIGAGDLTDFDRVAHAVARMTPIWKPGTQNGYHAATMGMVCDELARRRGGGAIHVLFEREFKSALALNDLFIGLPPKAFDRMAPMEVDARVRTTQPQRAQFSDFINSRKGASIPLSWVGGYASATDLAKLFNVLALGGTVGSSTFVSKRTIEAFMAPTNAADSVDKRLQYPVRWGAGLMLGDTPAVYGSRTHHARAGHAGGGASVAWADPDKRLAVAFLCNRMTWQESWERYRRIADAVDGSLV